MIECLGVLPKCLGRQSVQELLSHYQLCSENGQFCAIKEVQVISDDPHSKERLKQLNQEIDMLKKASHPNVVQYYDSDMVSSI